MYIERQYTITCRCGHEGVFRFCGYTTPEEQAQREARLRARLCEFCREQTVDERVLHDDDTLLVERNDLQAPGYIGPGNCVRVSGGKLGNVVHPDIAWQGARPCRPTLMRLADIVQHIDAKYVSWLQHSAVLAD